MWHSLLPIRPEKSGRTLPTRRARRRRSLRFSLPALVLSLWLGAVLIVMFSGVIVVVSDSIADMELRVRNRRREFLLLVVVFVLVEAMDDVGAHILVPALLLIVEWKRYWNALMSFVFALCEK